MPPPQVRLPIIEPIVENHDKEATVWTTPTTVPNQVDAPVPPLVPRAPYPQRLVVWAKKNNFQEILEVFKGVHINIPFLTAIQQIPAYAKFLKDLCTTKRRTIIPRDVFLAQEMTDYLKNTHIPKYADPRSPTISCTIGENFTVNALLDLGASVNLLPLYIYEKLGLTDLKPSHVRLQLADRSIVLPRGIIEDVLIKVTDFYYPVDFLILDTLQTSDNTIPIILGRPFLATTNANINCRNGSMTLSFGNLTAEVNVFKLMKQIPDEPDLDEICVIEEMIDEVFEDMTAPEPYNTIVTLRVNDDIFRTGC